MSTSFLLYKYCNPAGTAILKNNSIKVTPPKEFNDPFEFASRPTGKWPLKKVVKELQDEAFLQKLYKMELEHQPGITFEEYREFITTDPDTLEDIRQKTENLMSVYPYAFADQVSKRVGIVSFSQDHQNILMWSHYAENHTGFVIGFEAAKIPYLKLFGVKYSDSSIPEYDLEVEESSDAYTEQYTEIMCRKSPVWEYEKELRISVRLEDCDYLEEPGLYIYNLPPESFNLVILGCRMTQKTREQLSKILSEERYSHVKVIQAMPSTVEYKLEMQRII